MLGLYKFVLSFSVSASEHSSTRSVSYTFHRTNFCASHMITLTKWYGKKKMIKVEESMELILFLHLNSQRLHFMNIVINAGPIGLANRHKGIVVY